MRPVRRGASPKAEDYEDYSDAKTDLISRISSGQFKERHIAAYCSYCERKIDTNLAVEHIEPKKGDYAQPQLKGRWDNFLLACVNCNSTKGDKQVLFDKLFFPDRDNTFYAFEYLADGAIIPASYLTSKNNSIAENTLILVGLDKALRKTNDVQGDLIAQDRAGQRMEVWGIAESALDDYLSAPIAPVKQLILKNMLSNGFFSVWMTVFKDQQDMCLLFIGAISGTEESACFDTMTGDSIISHPNADCLINGSKI